MNALVRVCMLFPDLEGFKRKSNDQLTRSTSSQMSRARKVNKKERVTRKRDRETRKRKRERERYEKQSNERSARLKAQ